MPSAQFVWYELMTSDASAAVSFYEAAIGWKAKDSGMPGDMPYTLMCVGDAQVAGVMGTPPELAAMGAPPTWSGYIAVDDVDAMEARLLKAGGKVLRPAQDIPNVGRFAVVADPQGAAFMLFTPRPGDPPVSPPAGAPGTAGWRELMSADWKAGFEFYSSLFGWKKGEGMDMGEMGTYQLFEIDGVPSGGMMNKMPDMPASYWRYYFNVEAVDAATERIVAHGGTITMPAQQVPGGNWVVQARDPQGAIFSVLSMVK
jgi:predicted enzyme related to lactoylglutathione lyase